MRSLTPKRGVLSIRTCTTSFGSMFRPLIICLISCLASSFLYAQSELRFDLISVDNGLSSSVINSIIQDDDGFVWIATRDGLNKYDGVNIEVIRFSTKNNIVSSIVEANNKTLWVGVVGLGLVNYDPITKVSTIFSSKGGNDASLRDNDITFIHEDKNGDIWLGTKLKGLERLDTASGLFTTFLEDEGSPNVSYFHEDPKGSIWVGTDRGMLYLFDSALGKFIPYTFSTEKDITVTCIVQFDENDLVVGTDRGIYYFDAGKKEFKKFDAVYDEKVQAIWRDNEEQLWAASGNEILKFDLSEERILHRVQLKDHMVVPKFMDRNSWNFIGEKIYLTSQDELPVLVDDENNFWLITNKGLDLYLTESNELKEIRIEDSFTNFSRSQITCSFKDSAGTLWFGTVGGGINKHNRSDFKHYQYKRDVANSLAHHGVLSFHENEEGRIWIGNNGGYFCLFDPQKETFERYNMTGSNSVTFDILQRDQHLWLASAGIGLVNFNLESEKFKFYKHDPVRASSIPSNQVQALHQHDDVHLWVGTDKGLSLFNTVTGNFKRIDLQSQLGVEPNIFHIMKKGNSLWLGTLGQGVMAFDLSDSLITHVFDAETLEDAQVNDFITSIHIDDESTLYASTYGGGLTIINLDQKSHEIITTANGLLNNVIYYVTEDTEGNLWFTSNAGLTKFDKTEKQVIINFDKYDGLQSNEFNRGAGMKRKNGDILIGGINGFNSFNPLQMKRELFLSNTVFTTFEIFGENNDMMLANAVQAGEPIVLDDTQNSIAIGFATLDLRNPSKNQYRYRMKGLSDRWVEVMNMEPKAVFTSLDPGEYFFELFAANSDGVWMEHPTILEVVVLPPFWQTNWFRLLIALTLIFFSVIIPYGRIQRLRKRSHKLNALINERTYELQGKNNELNQTLLSLKEAQEQLVESEKMASLGTLSAGVGHEINNPLNFIRGGASALEYQFSKDDAIDKKKYQPVLDSIIEGVDRASIIVRSLSHFSRKGTKMDEECNIEDILDNCLTLLDSSIKGTIEVRKNYQSDGSTFSGNEGRLHQAFLNILTNAVHAISGPGSIDISTKKTGRNLLLTITDSGVGIKKDLLPKVLDPFFTTKAPGVGTGLGLSITYSILKEHRAEMKIDSEEGKGTVVSIKFKV